MKKDKQFCLILTTCPGPINAKQIAQHLVANHKAACVNILPGVLSYFWWNEEVEKTSEWLLLVKTTNDMFEDVKASIEKLHEYETPEIISIPIIAGSEEYLEWINQSTE